MSRSRRNCSRLLAVVLCHVLAAQAVLGQQALQIVVQEGDGARNVVQQIAARPITVRVQDAQGRPVAGASVVFTSPQVGPSGEFSNDLRTLELTTDSIGQASADHYHPNAITGSYSIDVVAAFQNQSARIQIKQENVNKGKSHGKMIAIIVVAGAAVAAILVSTLRKKTPSTPATPATPPTITLGGTAVGAPTP